MSRCEMSTPLQLLACFKFGCYVFSDIKFLSSSPLTCLASLLLDAQKNAQCDCDRTAVQGNSLADKEEEEERTEVPERPSGRTG